MLLKFETGRHATLASKAVLERYAHQAALQVISPGVINATESLPVAAALVEANKSAPVYASILKGVKLAVRIACDDDGSIPNEAGGVIAGIRDLNFETQVVPAACLEEVLLLVAVDVLALESPIGYSGQAVRPAKGLTCCGMRGGVTVHGIPFCPYTMLTAGQRHFTELVTPPTTENLISYKM
jgi:hypothetical protein